MPAVAYQPMRRHKMCARVAENSLGGRCERLLEDDAGEIGMRCGGLNCEIGAEVFTDENDGIDRKVPGSRQVADGRIRVFAPPRFTGMGEAALPVSAKVKGKNIQP